jgi:hypothetical protein
MKINACKSYDGEKGKCLNREHCEYVEEAQMCVIKQKTKNLDNVCETFHGKKGRCEALKHCEYVNKLCVPVVGPCVIAEREAAENIFASETSWDDRNDPAGFSGLSWDGFLLQDQENMEYLGWTKEAWDNLEEGPDAWQKAWDDLSTTCGDKLNDCKNFDGKSGQCKQRKHCKYVKKDKMCVAANPVGGMGKSACELFDGQMKKCKKMDHCTFEKEGRKCVATKSLPLPIKPRGVGRCDDASEACWEDYIRGRSDSGQLFSKLPVTGSEDESSLCDDLVTLIPFCPFNTEDCQNYHGAKGKCNQRKHCKYSKKKCVLNQIFVDKLNDKKLDENDCQNFHGREGRCEKLTHCAYFNKMCVNNSPVGAIAWRAGVKCLTEVDAAAVLGYDELSWDNGDGLEVEPLIEDNFDIFNNDQQAAAAVLGLTLQLWDSGISTFGNLPFFDRFVVPTFWSDFTTTCEGKPSVVTPGKFDCKTFKKKKCQRQPHCIFNRNTGCRTRQ